VLEGNGSKEDVSEGDMVRFKMTGLLVKLVAGARELLDAGISRSRISDTVGGAGVPLFVRLVEGAIFKTPRGGLQNDTRDSI
jgi:hypothetical protein